MYAFEFLKQVTIIIEALYKYTDIPIDLLALLCKVQSFVKHFI